MFRAISLLALLAAWLALAVSGASAECALCLDNVQLQTRDGQPWTSGQPVTLVVHVARTSPLALPPGADAVVMQTDGDRTKCLGVPLKLVSSDASGGTYAGLFFPIRPARYDGQLVVAGDVQPITFDVHKVAAGAAPAGELPAAEKLDTSATAPDLLSVLQLPAAVALVVLALGGLMAPVVRGRQRRPAADSIA